MESTNNAKFYKAQFDMFGNFYGMLMKSLHDKKENDTKLDECKYCGHSLAETEDPMICSECNSWQGKTEEEIGEELSDFDRGN